MKFFPKILNKINTGDDRSVVIKRNIVGSFIIKGASMLTMLMLVPITLNILDNEKYGIWITIYSIVNWFNIMDIGLGNGFRNKFAEAIAMDNISKAKKYISTLYTSTFLISFGGLFIYSIINEFLNWNKILNIPTYFDENISEIVFLIFGLFSLQFFFKNISTILLSLQKTALSNAIVFISNILSLIVIIFLGKMGYASLRTISIAFMLSPILVNGITTLVLFHKQLKRYLPNKIEIDRASISNMMNLGIRFFIIQITTIVMFSSGNIIITQLYGPTEVTPFNITNQFFSFGMTIFSIITAPFWSAYTEALIKKDFNWIKSSIASLKKIWIIFAALMITVLLFSPIIFKLWIGETVQIPFSLSASFAFYVIILSWTSIYAQFLNGTGKIRIQLYISITQFITIIPLAIFLANILNLGTVGIILATNINLLLSAIILPIQTKKIYNQKAYNIWNE